MKQVWFDDMDISGTILTLPNQLSLYFEYQKGNYLPMASIVYPDMVATVWNLMHLQVKMCRIP